MAESFPKPIKDILEALGNLIRNKRKSPSRCITVKLLKTKDKNKQTCAAQNKQTKRLPPKGVAFGLSADF